MRGDDLKQSAMWSYLSPEARLYRKGGGQEARLCYLGHVLMEDRSGLAVAGELTQASGTAERRMRGKTHRHATLGADNAYDTTAHVATLREQGVTPHVAQNATDRQSAIDARTTRHPGYAMSQHARRRIERIFGWGKTVGLPRKTRHRGKRRVGFVFRFHPRGLRPGADAHALRAGGRVSRMRRGTDQRTRTPQAGSEEPTGY